jgi:hypothetical protein
MMPSLIILALLAFIAPTLAVSIEEAQARVKSACPAIGRPCECAWHVRDCLPACHIQLRIECRPT